MLIQCLNSIGREKAKHGIGQGMILVAIAASLWGTTGIAGWELIGVYHVPALTIAAWRLVIAAPCLLILQKSSERSHRKQRVDKGHRLWFLIYSLAVACYQLCYFCALNTIPVSVVSIVALCLAPIFVACLAPFLVKESINIYTVTAILVSIAGTIMIIGMNSFAKGANVAGYLLAVVAGGCYALYNLCGKKLSADYSPEYIVSRVFGLASLFLLPALLATPRLSWDGWLCLLYLGIISSALAYILFQAGLKTCRATSASVMSLLEPLVSTLLSIFILGEHLSLTQSFGGVMLIVSFLLLSKKQSAGRLKNG